MAYASFNKKLVLLLALATGCAPLHQVPKDIADRYPLRTPNLAQHVDFHNHTVLKPYCQEIERVSDTQKITSGQVHDKAWTLNTAAELNSVDQGLFSSVKTYRQSAWGQLSSYGLICTSIYPSEKGLVTDGSWFYRLVKPGIWKSITGVSGDRMKGIVKNWSITPLDEFEYEYQFLKAQDNVGPNGERVFVVNSRSQLRQHVAAAASRTTGLVHRPRRV